MNYNPLLSIATATLEVGAGSLGTAWTRAKTHHLHGQFDPVLPGRVSNH